MKLLVADDHAGEGTFPVFPRGTAVDDIMPCDEVPHWSACSINGMETFIPDTFLAEGKLTEDYDPTELIIRKGDIVELRRIVYEWLYVKTETGALGWLPASKTVSIGE